MKATLNECFFFSILFSFFLKQKQQVLYISTILFLHWETQVVTSIDF